MSNRQEVLEHIRQNPDVSVLVVGAGVNGIGLFRELAVQGVDVLIIDKADFASGASAGSSHMLHGGLRYLENAEFRLVREALHERNLLIKNAPHYARPLLTTVPIFKWFSGFLNAPLKFLNLLDKPSERGALVIKIGLTFYDLFIWRSAIMPRHKFVSRKESLKQRPALNPDIAFTATYYDGQIPYPERLCLELILDTEAQAEKAKAINYMRMDKAEGDIVTLKDELTGETYSVKPKVVVNAAGPWIDFANRNMQQATDFIGGTKGGHLVVDNPELRKNLGESELFFENKDGRIVLLLPFFDKVMMGTTDIPVENPDGVVCTEEEIEYILGLVEHVFPSIKVEREDIVFTFSGVRPLPAVDAKNPGQITRDHVIEFTETGNGINFPVYSMVSGKWTTFRAFAEQTADKVLNQLNQPHTVDTHHMPIGGGKDYPETEAAKKLWLKNLQEKTGLSMERVQDLFEYYGTRAREIAEFIIASDDKLLDNHPHHSQREMLFLAQQEKVTHLDDIFLRRTLIGMRGQTTLALVNEVADILAPVLGWSDAEKQAEIDRTVKIFKENHRVELK